MTDHTPAGLIRPDDAEQVKDVGKFLRQHANSVQAGRTASVDTSAAYTGPHTITFPVAFAAAPEVVLTLVSYASAPITPTVTARTATTATFYVRSSTGAAGTATFAWVAVGRGTETGG